MLVEIETPLRLIRVASIKMHHAKAVAHWRGLVASANEKMGGVHTGIGFIGSLGWVVAGSVVLGALEAVASSKNAKEGFKLLGDAGSLMTEIRARGLFMPVSTIANIEIPKPAMWQSVKDDKFFVMLDEEFLPVLTDESIELMLRWSSVVSIRCITD